ncbi:hypothetical protein Agabi119p4_4417 [Agaricus bisporus var. burnettii]|uniref:Ankyrin n=1 Tax=Agaricus bisporus var. burnettii TaxID=192524 RepID=A0A8H7KGX5_AGABI|nr:hypothetical protein Agabi119p4_4417 [Agaricus bisporus var. burnettii]
MAEKDAPSRLRRAVKENNLFLVKRLVQRVDMRNPDPSSRRLTSLAWAALLANEETFEFLLVFGHDDEDISRDSENNTILMILADSGPPPQIYSSSASTLDFNSATLRMARLYYDRYQSSILNLLDWSNVQGRTALHLAAIKGNEDLVRMFCELGADMNLPDKQGNTPLHYASAWGHVPIVQLLIERGCNYNSRNNEGFTASDYAYSFSTQEMQKTAEKQYELTKKSRRAGLQNGRPLDFGTSPPINIPPSMRDQVPRMRSGSGTSHFFFSFPTFHGIRMATFSGSLASLNPVSALAPIANRVRTQDADARGKYMLRNRSGSSSTDNKSQSGSAFSNALAIHDELPTSSDRLHSGSMTPRRLRPSASAAQLRSRHDSPAPGIRTRAGTNPMASTQLTRLSSITNSPFVPGRDAETYHGPPSQYARFPEPPPIQEDSSTPTAARRKAFQILSKPLPPVDHSSNHRRGMSATAVRGPQ